MSYQFPFEEETINAKKIQTTIGKHRYKMQCSSTHKLSIHDNIHEYMGESTLALRVALDFNHLFGDLHSEDLVFEGSSIRVVPLFTASGQGIHGKVKLRVTYIQRKTSEALGKETIRDVFCPNKAI